MRNRVTTKGRRSCRPAAIAPEGTASARRRLPGQRGREPFLLRHVEGLTIEELAGMLRMEKNNVAVKLHRIRRRLQAEMER